MNIGQNITNLRKEKELTQEELAKLINVSPKTISSYETNRSIPNIETLILLANALNTNINIILGLNNDNANIINKAYQKKNSKDNIIKIILIAIILIVPIAFFWYAGYISIAAFAARLYNLNIVDNQLIEIAQLTLGVFTAFTKEYIIYLILLILNYIFYKKKMKKTLLIINSLILIYYIYFIIENFIINGAFIPIETLIFSLASLIGLGFFIKLIKEKRTIKSNS